MTAIPANWVKGVVAAMDSRDIDQLLSFYTDDCVWENVAQGRVVKGKEELGNYFKEIWTGFPDFKSEIKSSFASDHQLCIETVISGTHEGNIANLPPPTGKFWSVPSVRVCEFKEGKCCRSTMYYDMVSIGKQMGMLPEPQP